MVDTANMTVTELRTRLGLVKGTHTRNWMVPSLRLGWNVLSLYALAQLVPPRGP